MSARSSRSWSRADHPRDHALIRFLYNGGLRVSEAVALEWRNLVDGIANIRGKGGRTRVVLSSCGTWAELEALAAHRRPGHRLRLPGDRLERMVRFRRAARKAGLEALVSPHFLRHSHGAHALHRGADLATSPGDAGPMPRSPRQGGATCTSAPKNPAAITAA